MSMRGISSKAEVQIVYIKYLNFINSCSIAYDIITWMLMVFLHLYKNFTNLSKPWDGVHGPLHDSFFYVFLYFYI